MTTFPLKYISCFSQISLVSPRSSTWIICGLRIPKNACTSFIPIKVWSMTLYCRKKFLCFSRMAGPLSIQRGNVLKFLCQFYIDSTKESLLSFSELEKFFSLVDRILLIILYWNSLNLVLGVILKGNANILFQFS